jgi:hypothetical protein
MRWSPTLRVATWTSVLTLSWALGSPAAGQSPHASTADSTAEIVPGARYAKGGLSASIAGHHYRDAWTTPIKVPVLDMERFAGGLTPLEAHTGSQTKSLRLAGADGHEYQFRSVDKDPTSSLSPELQRTGYATAIRDGVSASFPAAAVIASGLLEAAGVLHTGQTLAVMPDDPRLGQFREDFKGVLGMVEERPDKDADPAGPYGRPLRVLSPTRAMELFDASPADRADARAFLRARLVDILMGDRDRHRDQWRWAAFTKKHPILWQPISRDHDEAFVQLDGLALDITRLYYQPLIQFEAKYPSHDRLNWHAREIDRRFLTELDREAWDSVARAVQQALSDSAIEAAVHRMPPEMYPVAAERLTRLLRVRRDSLVKEALSYYAFLAREVELRGTNIDESAVITRVDDHAIDVAIRARGDSQPYFQRRFDDRETRDIRLRMWGGDDSVTVLGDASPDITVRVVGGTGNDVFVDSSRAGGVKFYDNEGTNVSEGTHPVALNTKPYQEWVGSDTNRYPPREWGSWWRPIPWAAVTSDLGLFIGAGFLRTGYGFRKSPYATNLRGRIGFSTAVTSFRADLDGEFHVENASRYYELHLLASGLEVLHYYGQGNTSDSTGGSDFHRVKQQVLAVEPALVVPVGPHSKVTAGLAARWSHTGDNTGKFIAPLQDTLLGAGDFGQAGAMVGLEIDRRDRIINPLHGFDLTAEGRLWPAVWDVPSTFGSAEAEAKTFLSASIPTTPTLALRAGGKKVWGTYPFQESAFVGGHSTLRGFHSHRFAGDASLYGSAELRLTTGLFRGTVPALWGFFGNADIGRVYVDGDSPGGWHTGVGGGLWAAFLARANAASIGITFSDEGETVYAGAGFSF